MAKTDKLAQKTTQFPEKELYEEIKKIYFDTNDNYYGKREYVMKPKEPWLAVFLSFLIPGFGQIYAKKNIRGLILFFLTLFLDIILIGWFKYLLLPEIIITLLYCIIFILLVIAFLFFRIFLLIDSYRCAQDYNLAREIQNSNRKIKILSIIGLIGFILFIGSSESILFHQIGSNHFKTYKIPAASMLPTLQIKDYVLLNKTYYDKSLPQRGDVVVFKYPVDPSKDFVKRVIGLPGDELEIRNKIVFINGIKISEPYAQNIDPRVFLDDPTMPKEMRVRDNLSKLKVPEEQYFVMSDNHDYGLDSRFFGFVPKENIKGKIQKIYWPLERSGKVQ